MEKEFIALLNQHPGILHKICRIYGPDEDDRKDLFQEIVLQLWWAYPTFRRDANASTWMYRIALNTAVSAYRKQRRKPPLTPFSRLAFRVPDLPELPPPPDELARLYAAIAQLTAVEKALVTLYLDEKSYDEMSAILGISKSNVGVRLNRIRTKLEKLVKSFAN